MERSLKGECFRQGTPLSLDDARRRVEGYVEHYNNVRLNSAIGYITPKEMLAGRQQQIQAGRDRKLGWHENRGRFVGSRLREERIRPISCKLAIEKFPRPSPAGLETTQGKDR